ncbi:MAG: hypothetical protein J2P48_20520 [Alphaproteobacteria bacterium]|nr:hypothetical protein [Alphaproteobacteria bacterium]
MRHEHVASLGAVLTNPTVGDRVEFWTRLYQRLGRLANRLDNELQAKVLASVHARIPMPTVEEALQLEQAREHETAWRLSHVHAEGIVETNRALRDGAGKRVAEGEPLLAIAAKELKAAKDRRKRIERGESVPFPGQPPAHARYAMTLAQLTPEQFERFLKFGRRPSERGFLRAEAKRHQTL